VLNLSLNGKSEDLLRIRSLLQSIGPLSEVQESSQQHPEPTNDAKFEPKFGFSGVLSDDEFKYSAVIITNVTHPFHWYIQMMDQDLPLYHQLQVDLQEEFGSATSESQSYSPTLTAGIFPYFYLCKKFNTDDLFNRQSLCSSTWTNMASSFSREDQKADGILCRHGCT